VLRWLARLLFGSDHPSVRRIMACEDAVQALDARVDRRYEELVALRGVVSRRLRAEKAVEDAPEATNDADPLLPSHPVSSTSTAHLARRFKAVG